MFVMNIMISTSTDRSRVFLRWLVVNILVSYVFFKSRF
uniref:Uncharacterized protein n=1 Tax=Leptospira santarosai serovar Arenal str. MAVJ 401 TaxID=1049976 RepID=M6K216_9LEPT|nr:hypothetical protein LEP1GSC063_3795 [Leptospira santarosai serovar Arenal str. MAVJ 401]